jgi:hypothetical protein
VRAALLLPLLLAACSGPAEMRNEAWQRAFYRGDPARAAAQLQRRLDAGGPDADVLRLELGAALLADGRPADAAPLFVEADGRLETLDYRSAPLETLAAFAFSVTPQRYRATRWERLLVNAHALLAFLAAGDAEEAAVEARRARVLLLQDDLPQDERYASVLVWALCGVALQAAGSPGEAADAFRSARALADGDPARLSALDALQRPAAPGEGAILLVVSNGKAPVRAQAIARLWVDHGLQRVQFPALVPRPGGYARMDVWLDGDEAPPPVTLLDVGGQSVARHADELPRLLAAALLAAVPRVLAAGAVRDAVHDDDRPDDSTRNILAELLGFLTGEALAELLPADTRCWTLLPAEFRVQRLLVPAGEHRVVLDLLDGVGEPRRVMWEVTLAEGEMAVVHAVTALEEGYAKVQPPGEADLTGTLAAGEALELFEAATGGD